MLINSSRDTLCEGPYVEYSARCHSMRFWVDKDVTQAVEYENMQEDERLNLKTTVK